MSEIKEDIVLYECPHCHGSVVIEAINCAIFRHAEMKDKSKILNPHASQQEMEQLIQTNSILGCGKPFRLNGNQPEVCDYL